MSADRDWMVKARCRSDVPTVDNIRARADQFFPEATGTAARIAKDKAARICRSCPVLFECREYARELNIPYGVWAGEGRPGVHGPGLGGNRPKMPHGTDAAARRHYRRGEKPCPACLEGQERRRA